MKSFIIGPRQLTPAANAQIRRLAEYLAHVPDIRITNQIHDTTTHVAIEATEAALAPIRGSIEAEFIIEENTPLMF